MAKKNRFKPLPSEQERKFNDLIRRAESLVDLLEGFKKRIERVILTQEVMDRVVGEMRDLKMHLQADIKLRRSGK